MFYVIFLTFYAIPMDSTLATCIRRRDRQPAELLRDDSAIQG
jgi:hypothetical protein